MNNSERMHPTIDNMVTAFLRDQFSLWTVEFIIGSKTATAEVIPANNIAMNNNGGDALRRKIAKRDKRRQKMVFVFMLAPFFVLFFLFTRIIMLVKKENAIFKCLY